jgi:hypothetical protein
MEKMDVDERVAELEARKQVVDGYLKRARKWLLSLQMRYKQLVVSGEDDNFARERGSSSGTTCNAWDGQSQSFSPGSSSRGTSSDGSAAVFQKVVPLSCMTQSENSQGTQDEHGVFLYDQ